MTRAVLLEEAAHPFHPRSLRASGPAVFRVPLLKGPSLYDFNPQNTPVIILGTKGVYLGRYPFPKTFGLVLGLEGPGLPDHLRGMDNVTIPMRPGVESLNAATAAGIVLYHWRTTSIHKSADEV